MRWGLSATIGGLLLCGCQSEASREEQRYEIVEKDRDNQAICEQAKRVADAYLRAADEANYKQWKLTSDIQCMNATYEPYNMQGMDPALMDGDNLINLPDNTGL